MIFLEILLEGTSDVPVIKEILTRRFLLKEGEHFRIHPHRGKGALSQNPHAKPDPKHQGLLDQLPTKLRGYSGLPDGYCVIVLVDADSTDCKELKKSLVDLYGKLDKRPGCVLFRIAVEEIESWFLADSNAVRSAYPRAGTTKLSKISPDSVIGAWERLAEALGFNPQNCGGGDKREWSTRISPHLNLDQPKSPSLNAFISGVKRLVERSGT